MFSKIRLAAIAAPFLLAACGGANSESPKASDTANPAPGATDTASSDSVVSDTDMVLGDPNAPLTVIEYASVTCPGCAGFHINILPEIKKEFIDTGKVRLVFREFPTPPVEFSYIGSVMARCAAEKAGADTYFLIIDALLKNQRTWIYGEDPKLELLKIATQAGMDEAAFDACLQRQELVDAMNARIEEGRKEYGIDSTPSFVIDGKKQTFRNVEDMRAALNEKLGIEVEAETADPAENGAEDAAAEESKTE